jgi:hypothetical protein
MIRITHMVALGAALAVVTQWWVLPPGYVRAGGQEAIVAGNPGPTREQIHSLFARMVENQHRDDRALEEFERIEHVVSRKDGENSEIIADRTDRVFPSGTGIMRLQTAQSNPPVSPELHRRQLQYAVNALDLYLHPNERLKQDLIKFEKRRRDRAELLDTSLAAFRATWVGRETRPESMGVHGSRTLAKFLLTPNPDYRATTRLTATFEHVRAVIWVDESQAQMVRLEGDIASDITFGGGIVGKVYHGGHFVMEQSEVAPGIWLPTHYNYDVDGRKFLFGFGIHERTEVTNYRRVGPPAQSIEIIRNELNRLVAETPAR